jgi:hypothetical protein
MPQLSGDGDRNTREDLSLNANVTLGSPNPGTVISAQNDIKTSSRPGVLSMRRSNKKSFAAAAGVNAVDEDPSEVIIRPDEPRHLPEVQCGLIHDQDLFSAAAPSPDPPFTQRNSSQRQRQLSSPFESDHIIAAASAQRPRVQRHPWVRTPSDWQRTEFEKCKGQFYGDLFHAFGSGDPSYAEFFDAFDESKTIFVGSSPRMTFLTRNSGYISRGTIETRAEFESYLQWDMEENILLVENCSLNLAEELARRFSIPFCFFMSHWLDIWCRGPMQDVSPP